MSRHRLIETSPEPIRIESREIKPGDIQYTRISTPSPGRHRKKPEIDSIQAGTITADMLVSDSITVRGASSTSPGIRARKVPLAWVFFAGIFVLIWADVYYTLKLLLVESWYALIPGSAVISGLLIYGIYWYSNRRLTT